MLLDRGADNKVILVVKIPNFIIALADSNSKDSKSPLTRSPKEIFPLNNFVLKTLYFLLPPCPFLSEGNAKLCIEKTLENTNWNIESAIIVTAIKSKIRVVIVRMSTMIGARVRSNFYRSTSKKRIICSWYHLLCRYLCPFWF